MGKEPKSSDGGILIGRLQLVGEEIIPKDLLVQEDGRLWIFLTEPDLEKWPPEMKNVKAWMEKNVVEEPMDPEE